MVLALAEVSVDRVNTPMMPIVNGPRVTIVSSRIHGTSRPVGEAHVGGEHVVVLVAHPRAERVDPPVELVVAESSRGVAEPVVDPRDRPAVGEIRRQRSLKLVAAVDEYPLAVGRRALRLGALDRRG